MCLGKRLKDLRIEKGIKQEDLSYDLFEKYEIECCVPAISNYERGCRTPGYQTLVSLADYYNVTVDYLLGRTDNKRDSSIKKKSNLHILDAVNFGETLRRLRESVGLKQEDLSKELYCSVAALSNYEKGYRTPGYQTLISLADYFDVPIDYLLGIADTANNHLESINNIEKDDCSEQVIGTHISDTNYLNIEKRLLDKYFLKQVKVFFEDACIPREIKDKFYKEISLMYLNML